MYYHSCHNRLQCRSADLGNLQRNSGGTRLLSSLANLGGMHCYPDYPWL